MARLDRTLGHARDLEGKGGCKVVNKIIKRDLEIRQLINGCNWPHIDPFLTKPVPNESGEKGLSNKSGFVKNGSLLIKLWYHKVSQLLNKAWPRPPLQVTRVT